MAGRDIPVYQPELSLQPGTYRIVGKPAGTSVQVSDHDHRKIVAWETHDRRNQQWFVQSSGDGYKFKNCQYGNHISATNKNVYSRVYANRFPTTWVLLKVEGGYLIRYPDSPRLIDLHFGWGSSGNTVHLMYGEDFSNRKWKFERLSNETGEDLPIALQQQAEKLSRELQAEIRSSALKDTQIVLLEREMQQKDHELTEKDAAIRQLKRKDQALSAAREENEEKGDGLGYIASWMSRLYDEI